jgi:uncharacterized protein YndB with AHSA1/START domain
MIQGTSTRVSRIIKAPRKAVYRAFLDPGVLAAWLPPETMTGQVHTLEPRVGGRFHLTLTYPDPSQSPRGKSSENTDTVAGTFAELVPDEKIVWVTKFESPDPSFAGEMMITWSFADALEGTEVTVLCENIPRGIRPGDNEAGTRSSLENLARFLER